MKKIKASYALLIAVGLLMTLKLSATTYTNTALTGLWGSSGSWSGAQPSVGGAADAVIVLNPSANAVITNDMSGAFSLNQLKLVANKHETLQSINGSSLSFAGSGASITNVGSGGNFTINSPITLGADLMVGNASSVKLTLSSNITESVASGLILNSESTRLVYLAGSNTFSGGVTLNGGGVEINNAASLGTGTFTINNGTTFNNIGPSTVALANASVWNGNIAYVGSAANLTMNGPVTLGSNVTLAVNGYTLTVNGNITGPGSLTKVGTSVLTLGGANSFSGDFVWAGTLNVYSASGLPLGSGSLTISNALTLTMAPAGSGSDVTLLGGTNGNKTISFDGQARLTITKGSQNSVAYTFGNAADTGSVFTRIGKGTLVNTASTGKFLLANGAAGAPIHNGMVDAYIVALSSTSGTGSYSPLQYDPVNGFTNLVYDSGFASGVTDNTKKYSLNNNSHAKLSANTTAYALYLSGTSDITLTNNAVLTIGNGAQPAFLGAYTGTITNATGSSGSKLDFGSSEGMIYATGININTPIDGIGGVTYSGISANSINLTANNLYSGQTTVLAGGLQIGNGGSLAAGSTVRIYSGGTLTVNSGGTIHGAITNSGTVTSSGLIDENIVNNGTLTLNSGGTVTGSITINNSGAATVNGGSTTADILVNGTLTLAGSTPPNVGTLTALGTLNQYNTYTTDKGITLTFPSNSSLGTFNAAASTKTTLSNGGGTTSFANFAKNLNSANIIIDGGTWNINSMAQNNSNAQFGGTLNVINGATFSLAGSRYAGHGTWNVGGTGSGTINIGSGWSVENPANNYSFAYNAFSGGTINFVSGVTLATGANTVPTTTSMLVTTGGVISVTGSLTVGGTTVQGAGGTLTNTLNVAGGKLVVNGTLSQAAPLTAVVNNFIWSAGQITATTITTTNLAGGILTNSSGTLAPGDIGVPGKTTITGNYTESSANAMLAIDIGGTKQGDAFTNVPGYYDYVVVTSNAYLVGKLSVSLINGYTPPSTKTNFTVLTVTGTGATLSGSFANVLDNKVWCTDGYSRFDVLFNTTAKKVILTNYVANAWSPTSGSTWDTPANWSLATEPNGSGMAAYFGTGGSGTVTLDTAHTVRGLIFTNGAASYTIAGAALTLQGDTMTAPKISVLAGSHTISAAMALSNATEIAVAMNSVLTLTGGITGGQAVTKTGTGTLALGDVNTLGSLTVSAGTVQFASGSTTVSALIITAGATCDFTAGTLYILKGVAGGAIDTIDEVNAAITANTITLRGKSAQPIDFKVTEEGDYIKVTAKVKGTMIMVM